MSQMQSDEQFETAPAYSPLVQWGGWVLGALCVNPIMWFVVFLKFFAVILTSGFQTIVIGFDRLLVGIIALDARCRQWQYQRKRIYPADR